MEGLQPSSEESSATVMESVLPQVNETTPVLSPISNAVKVRTRGEMRTPIEYSVEPLLDETIAEQVLHAPSQVANTVIVTPSSISMRDERAVIILTVERDR